MTTLNRPSNLRGWFVSTEQSEGAKPEDPVFKELLDSVEPIAPATELKARAAYLVEQGDLAVKGDLPDYEKAEGFEENRRLLWCLGEFTYLQEVSLWCLGGKGHLSNTMPMLNVPCCGGLTLSIILP